MSVSDQRSATSDQRAGLQTLPAKLVARNEMERRIYAKAR